MPSKRRKAAPTSRSSRSAPSRGAAPLATFVLHATRPAAAGGAAPLEIIPDPGDQAQFLPAPLQGHFGALCKLWSLFESKKGPVWRAGTGFVIGNGRLATAAHVLFDQQYGGYAARVEVSPAQAGDLRPFGVQTVAYPRIAVTQAFGNDPDSPYDVGTIFLKQPFPSMRIGMATSEGIDLANARVSVAGYRQDLKFAHEHTAPLVGTAALQLYHRADTLVGQSGSPVMIRIGAQWVAVGIHVAGSEEVPANLRPANCAVRLTQSIINWLNAPPPTS